MKRKKEPLLKRFKVYMGGRSYLLKVGGILSVLSSVFSIVPFVLVWYVIRQALQESNNMNMDNLGIYAWGGFISAVLAMLLYFAALMTSHLVAFRVETGIQKVAMRKLLLFPLGFFVENSGGKIRKIVNDGASSTHTFLAHNLPDIAGAVATPLIVVILLFLIDPRMGAAILVPVILSFVFMGFTYTKKGQEFQKKYFDSLEEMSGEAVEYVRGIPVVKTFGQSVHAFKKFYNSIINYREMVYEYTKHCRTAMMLYQTTIEIAALFVLPLAIIFVGRGENVGVVIADFSFYVMSIPILTMMIMKSMYFKQNFMIAQQALDRIDGLMKYPEMDFPSQSCPTTENSIEFRDVTFTYPGSDKPAIENVSFKVDEGQTVALVGISGGGKTTIARLAARFWDTDIGEVMIGGKNIKSFSKQQLMNTVSFVFQNSTLMKDSLRENIKFGKENIEDEQIMKAVELSQSTEIIENQQDGLDTLIGSEGTYLSGGEQQRIALARAILKDAPIALMDEATAFSDPENEHLIQKALRNIGKNKTTLMIAHRLSSVIDADKILVVDSGRIVESGTHSELLEQNGKYKRMWEEYQKSLEWKVDNLKRKEIGKDD